MQGLAADIREGSWGGLYRARHHLQSHCFPAGLLLLTFSPSSMVNLVWPITGTRCWHIISNLHHRVFNHVDLREHVRVLDIVNI
jgi:hypothetical protein